MMSAGQSLCGDGTVDARLEGTPEPAGRGRPRVLFLYTGKEHCKQALEMLAQTFLKDGGVPEPYFALYSTRFLESERIFRESLSEAEVADIVVFAFGEGRSAERDLGEWMQCFKRLERTHDQLLVRTGEAGGARVEWLDAGRGQHNRRGAALT